jgi:hypothetical protein
MSESRLLWVDRNWPLDEVVAVMAAGTGGGSGVRSDVLFASSRLRAVGLSDLAEY